jgi:hypothetical protein
LAGKLACSPDGAQITKEQRHEQEIYFGADADHRNGICADRQLWLHDRPAKPAALDNQSIHLAFYTIDVAFNDRSNEFKHHYYHQHYQHE